MQAGYSAAGAEATLVADDDVLDILEEAILDEQVQKAGEEFMMQHLQLFEGMTDEQLQALILTTLKSTVIEDSATIVEKEKITAAKMDAALKSLNVDEYVSLEVIERKTIALTEEGEDNAKNGTPEFQYASAMEKG